MIGDSQPMLGRMHGDLPPFSCHCGPQVIEGRVQYLTYNEDEATGRAPVQTTSMGDYPSARDMGIEVMGESHDTDATFQRKPDGIHMSG